MVLQVVTINLCFCVFLFFERLVPSFITVMGRPDFDPILPTTNIET